MHSEQNALRELTRPFLSPAPKKKERIGSGYARLPTAIECLCCSEITEMMNKRSTEEVGCITLHPGFQSVCLNSSFNSIFTILLSIAICGLENPCIQANTLKPRVKSNTPYLVIHPTSSVDLLFIISVISLQQRHSSYSCRHYQVHLQH